MGGKSSNKRNWSLCEGHEAAGLPSCERALQKARLCWHCGYQQLFFFSMAVRDGAPLKLWIKSDFSVSLLASTSYGSFFSSEITGTGRERSVTGWRHRWRVTWSSLTAERRHAVYILKTKASEGRCHLQRVIMISVSKEPKASLWSPCFFFFLFLPRPPNVGGQIALM